MAFKKGQSGNPAGRPKGNIQRDYFKSLFAKDAPILISIVIDKAKEGDMKAMALCLDRILPRIKEDVLDFEIPDLIGKTPEQLSALMFEAMSGQTMSAEEINCILKMISMFRSSDDSEAIKSVIDKSNEILEELRVKNEREY